MTEEEKEKSSKEEGKRSRMLLLFINVLIYTQNFLRVKKSLYNLFSHPYSSSKLCWYIPKGLVIMSEPGDIKRHLYFIIQIKLNIWLNSSLREENLIYMPFILKKKIHWRAFYDIISNNHYLIIAIRKILIILQLFPMNLSHRPA